MAPIEMTVFGGSPSGAITQGTTVKEDLVEDQVLVKITHSGVCYTDVHFRHTHNVLGHEGVGIVERTGPGVKSRKVGDRVGWGYVRNSCGHCAMCLKGEFIYCPDAEHYGETNKDQGSFASHTIVNELYLVRIPDAIALEHAGPFMCGGATVFDPMSRYGLQANDVVGVIGIGGLGHLAIQFAAKMGAEVVVFSGSEDKREEAMKLGATQFYAMKGKKEGDIVLEKRVKFLYVCTSAAPEWSIYVPLLDSFSTVFPLTVDGGNMVFPLSQFNMRPINIQGSAVSSRYMAEKMLAFAARHGIQPIIQKFPMTAEGAEEAINIVEAGKMRYRGVLVAQN